MTTAIKINQNDGVTINVMTGGETEVDFDFPIYAATHIAIYETDLTGAITLLVKDTDYTVPAGSVEQQAGGTVDLDSGVYPSGATAGHIFTAIQAAPEERITDFNQAGDYFADTLNKELDLFAQQIQQIRRDLNRAAKLPIDTNPSTIPDVTLPDPEDEKVLAWDGTAGAIQNGPTIGDIANAATNAAAAASSATAAAASASSASSSASSASASAAAAASSAAEGLFNDVVPKAFADSPIAPLLSEEGTLFRIDTTAGAVVVNLDELATYGEDMKFAFVRVAGSNDITINRGGSDTIDAGTSVTIDTSFETHVLVGDSTSGNWIDIIQATQIQDNAVTEPKISDTLLNELTAITTLQDADQLWVADNSDGDNNKKITISSFRTQLQATETLVGTAEIATQAETDAGTDDTRFITPDKLSNYSYSGQVINTEVAISTTVDTEASVTVPRDSSIPQTSEMEAYPAIDITYTPLRSDSRILVELEMHLGTSASDATGIAAIVKNSGTQADAKGACDMRSALDIALCKATLDEASTGSAVTYHAYFGGTATTIFLNQDSSNNTYGGIPSVMKITEYMP